jgi:hypothetical protein
MRRRWARRCQNLQIHPKSARQGRQSGQRRLRPRALAKAQRQQRGRGPASAPVCGLGRRSGQRGRQQRGAEEHQALGLEPVHILGGRKRRPGGRGRHRRERARRRASAAAAGLRRGREGEQAADGPGAGAAAARAPRGRREPAAARQRGRVGRRARALARDGDAGAAGEALVQEGEPVAAADAEALGQVAARAAELGGRHGDEGGRCGARGCGCKGGVGGRVGGGWGEGADGWRRAVRRSTCPKNVKHIFFQHRVTRAKVLLGSAVAAWTPVHGPSARAAVRRPTARVCQPGRCSRAPRC